MMKQIERTAYHEAGHVVAAIVRHNPIGSLTIIPDKKNDYLGCADVKHSKSLKNFNPDSDSYGMSRRLIYLLKREIVILFSGSNAEKKYLGKPYQEELPGQWEDCDRILLWSSCLPGNEEIILVELFQEAIELIENNRNWFAIERLAEQLLIDKKINSRDARRVVKQALKEYNHE